MELTNSVTWYGERLLSLSTSIQSNLVHKSIIYST